MIQAVLFDLDDTLFDHRSAAGLALGAVCGVQPALAAAGMPALEERHSSILESLHARVLTGELSVDAARRERFRRLFEANGIEPAAALLDAATTAYRQGYTDNWREVRGAAALLRALRGRARVAIVSNNLTREQHDKLRVCGFDDLVDAVVISEEAGAWKPDPVIFRIALERLNVEAAEAVMIGDAWNADIAGARAVGMRAVWFNPTGRACPDPLAGVRELRSLEPTSEVLAVIFEEDQRDASASHHRVSQAGAARPASDAEVLGDGRGGNAEV